MHTLNNNLALYRKDLVENIEISERLHLQCKTENKTLEASFHEMQAFGLNRALKSFDRLTDNQFVPAAPVDAKPLRERLIDLFLFDKPHVITWNFRRKKTDKEKFLGWSSCKPVLAQLEKEGLVKQIDKTNTTVCYMYTPKS